MNLKDRENQLVKAREFIKGGKKEDPPPRANPPAEPQSHKKKPAPKKVKHVAYYLDVGLIKRVQIQAAKNGERPCHFVARTMEEKLKAIEGKNDIS